MAAPGVWRPPTCRARRSTGWARSWSAGTKPVCGCLDKEFAELFEQFVIEGGGEQIFAPRPGVLGVVPVRGSLKPEQMAAMEPHLDIDAHFQRHERFLVIPCVCKREREILHGHSCKMPMKRCGFVGLPPQTPLGETVLDREEAKSSSANSRRGARSPGVLRLHHGRGDSPVRRHLQLLRLLLRDLHGPKLAGLSEGPQKSNYRAVIDPEECISCGVCIERCPVNAIAEDENGKSKVDRAKCIGCGVCVIGCPTDAIEMVPVSEEEWFHVPSSMAEWEEMRLQNMAAEK